MASYNMAIHICCVNLALALPASKSRVLKRLLSTGISPFLLLASREELQPKEEATERATEEGAGEGDQGEAEAPAEPGSQPDAAFPEGNEAKGGHQEEGKEASPDEAAPEQGQQEQQEQPQQEQGPGDEQQKQGDQEEGQQQEGAEKGEGGEGQGEEADEEPPPPPPPQIIKVSVPKLVSRLHLSSGFMPDELSHMHSFYFIRGKPGKLQFEDLDEALECGVLNERPSLRNLEQVRLDSWVGGKGRGEWVSHALQQLNGDVTLEVPDVPIDSVDKAAADTELVMSLEQYMSEWSSTLASVMQVRNMLACLRLVFKDVTM
eukprot:1158274-Pelagomonas_calceolata.AAC.8